MFEVLNMPVHHYEMLVSHSPPVFSHSPPTGGFLTDFNSGLTRCYDPLRTPFKQQFVTLPQNKKSFTPLHIKMPASPKRSCLVIRPEDESLPDSPDSPTLPNIKTKKKVVFADDQGHALVEVRVMSEPSNVPPFWSLKFLAHITQGLISPVPPEQWTVDFKQPASDYLDFRRRLDDKNVSLENVIVKENESVVVGTVKVKNLGFNKEVIVRATWDSWKNQEDIFCTYSQIGAASGAYVLYDTFSFKITLPPSSSKLEFCVCFRCGEKEFWDNNQGLNYTLSKRISPEQEAENLLMNKKNDRINSNNTSPITIQKYPDITQAKIASWSEFSSWNHLENNCPYW